MAYFNNISLREKFIQLSQARCIAREELIDSLGAIKNKKIAIIGCGSQGLNQGLNLRDSGLNVSYALRQESIKQKRNSVKNAQENNFKFGSYQEIIPNSDIIVNLTPDKQHSEVIENILPYVKKDAYLVYCHGFNIIEEGMKIRDDITVIMIAPKGPGTEVREEYKRGFGVPSLIAVHPENDPQKNGLQMAKAYATALGADKAGVLEASFTAEVKSDLMGEQTILCGLLQTVSLLAFDKMIDEAIPEDYACKFIQKGWETLTEALKQGGITNLMNRLSNPAKIQAFKISEELKQLFKSLFEKHMDDILSGKFSQKMMADWVNDDKELLFYREQTAKTPFENATLSEEEIAEQEYFDKGTLLCAFIKAGVELAFDTMLDSGIAPEVAYYESLHELPLIANLISRKKLYEMNKVISDTAEYGNYLFANTATELLKNFFKTIDASLIGKDFNENNMEQVDNKELIEINEKISTHPVEIIGKQLRAYMTNMKKIITN